MLMVLIAGVLAGQHYRHVKVPDEADNDRLVEIVMPPGGRILIVLVDGTGIYCGTERAPKEAIEEYIDQTMKLNQARSFTVCGSKTARYGDVITLIDRLKKRGLRMAYIDTIPVESGTRLPLLY